MGSTWATGMGPAGRRIVAGVVALAVAAALSAVGSPPAQADSPAGWSGAEPTTSRAANGERIGLTGVCAPGAEVGFQLDRTSTRPRERTPYRIDRVSTTADDEGSFLLETVVPMDALPGPYQLYGYCDGRGEVYLEVILTGPDPRPDFSDLQGQGKHLEGIRTLAWREVTFGCAPDRFCPREDITRAQFASLLHRLLDLPTVAPQERFHDVAPRSTHGAAIEALAAEGIVLGCTEDRFCAEDPVRRDQAASLVARSVDRRPVDVSRSPFRDVQPGSTHAWAIELLRSKRILNGCHSNRFCTDDHLTRAQAASLLNRAHPRWPDD